MSDQSLTEAEKAQAYRVEAAVLLDELCKLIDRAKGEGFLVSFSTGENKDGKQVTLALNIIRKY